MSEFGSLLFWLMIMACAGITPLLFIMILATLLVLIFLAVVHGDADF